MEKLASPATLASTFGNSSVWRLLSGMSPCPPDDGSTAGLTAGQALHDRPELLDLRVDHHVRDAEPLAHVQALVDQLVGRAEEHVRRVEHLVLGQFDLEAVAQPA